MLMSIPLTTLVVLAITCASMLAAPGQPPQNMMASSLVRRQTNTTAMSQNGGMKTMTTPAATGASQQKTANMNAAAPAEMSDLEKEAKEATEEKKPGMNTIASAIKELYFHDKYASHKHDTAMLVKMVGQVAATNAKTCDPEVVSKGILAIFEPYNQTKPAAGAGDAPMKGSNIDDATPSLNTLAHAIHETWEKQITSGNPKLDNTQVLPLICQAIATSSTSGDPTVVAKAVESAYAKVAAN